MEGILFDVPSFGSAAAVAGGTILLGAALAVAILGRVSDGEAAGRRYFWAEWPLPETGEGLPSEEERKVHLAA